MIGSYIGLASCSDRYGSTSQLVKDASPTIEVSQVKGILPCWNLTTNPSTDFFEEAVDSMQFISLETTEKSLLGVINQVQKVDNKLIVVDAYKAQKILVFDMNGNFLYNIGAKGEGPSEYTSLNHVVITSQTVTILDWLTWKYIGYDLEGNILYEHRFQKSIPAALMQLDKNTFIGSHAGYFPTNPYQLTWINDKASILNTALPFRNPHGVPAGILQYTLAGSLLFYHNLCDTIYQIEGTKIVPKWRLGLYEPEEVDVFLKRTSEMEDKEYIKTLYDGGSTIVNYHFLLECTNFWIVEYQRGNFAYLSIVDKENARSRNYIRTDRSKQKCYVPFVIKNADENWLCTSISDQFYALLDEGMREEFFSKVKSEKDREMLRNYDIENQNPIVCLFHLK